MTNEIMKTSSFELAFEPARLEFENFGEMKKMVQDYAERYDKMVFEPEDKKGLEQARGELLALYNALETERKNVKRVYSEPLDLFEEKIKEMTALIQKPLDDVRGGIKAIDDALREGREDALRIVLSNMTKGKNIDISEIEIDNKWLNKGNWTDKFEPRGQLEAELENEVSRLIEKKERREHDVNVLTKYCESVGVEPSGWIEQLNYRSAMEIVESISLEIENKEPSEDSVEVEGEYSKTITETAEDDISPVSEAVGYVSNTITNTIQVTGTIKQLNGLNDYLVNSGIMVVQVDD